MEKMYGACAQHVECSVFGRTMIHHCDTAHDQAVVRQALPETSVFGMAVAYYVLSQRETVQARSLGHEMSEFETRLRLHGM